MSLSQLADADLYLAEFCEGVACPIGCTKTGRGMAKLFQLTRSDPSVEGQAALIIIRPLNGRLKISNRTPQCHGIPNGNARYLKNSGTRRCDIDEIAACDAAIVLHFNGKSSRVSVGSVAHRKFSLSSELADER